MEYRFVFDYNETEISVTLEAESDLEAIKKFIVETGVIDFGCFVENGRTFTSKSGWEKEMNNNSN